MADSINIALIDDDPAVLDALQLFLTGRGLKVSCFETAEEFMAAASRIGEFDCIVSDVRMPPCPALSWSLGSMHALSCGRSS
jgi:FixJ family two-component response regulator